MKPFPFDALTPDRRLGGGSLSARPVHHGSRATAPARGGHRLAQRTSKPRRGRPIASAGPPIRRTGAASASDLYRAGSPAVPGTHRTFRFVRMPLKYFSCWSEDTSRVGLSLLRKPQPSLFTDPDFAGALVELGRREAAAMSRLPEALSRPDLEAGKHLVCPMSKLLAFGLEQVVSGRLPGGFLSELAVTTRR